MANTYYQVTALNAQGQSEVLYGSFDRNDCTDEIAAEKDNWKADGYKQIKVTTKDTTDNADPEVYPDTMSKHEFWLKHAPDFNFELDEAQLVATGIERGFIALVGDRIKYLS